MKYFFIFLFSIFFITGVLATGFSPSSLTFNLAKGEEQCQSIHLDSDSSKISVIDVWAESSDSEWKISEFKTSSSEHNIIINYPKELSAIQRDVSICVTGKKVGEYHGAIIFKQQQEGNSVIQLAVWLKVIVDGESASKSSSSSSSSSGGGRGASTSTKSSSPEQLSANHENYQDISGNAKITGNTINTSGFQIPNYTGAIILSLIIVVGLSAVYYGKYKQKRKWMGYE